MKLAMIEAVVVVMVSLNCAMLIFVVVVVFLGLVEAFVLAKVEVVVAAVETKKEDENLFFLN